MRLVTSLTVTLLVAMSSCSESTKNRPDDDAGTGGDSDADSDTDTSSETDTTTDTAPDGWGEVANLCWITTFGSEGLDLVSALGRLADGSVVIGGWCGPDAVFAEGAPNETVLGGTDFGSTCLARFAPDGSLIWAKRVAVEAYSSGLVDGPPVDALAGTTDGGFIAAGHFLGTAVFGEGEANETTFDANDEVWELETDIFLARYSSDGLLLWARRDGDSEWEHVSAVSELPGGAIQTTGSFKAYTRLGCGDDNETYFEQYQDIWDWGGGFQQFVAQYAADGALSWASAEGGKETGKTIAALGTESFATSGFFPDEDYPEGATFGLGQENETVLSSEWGRGGFVSVLGVDGSLEWAVGAAGMDDVMFCSVAPFGDDSVLMAGQFVSLLEFGDDEDPLELYGEWGEGEVVLARYSSEGDLEWAAATKSPEGDFGDSFFECVRAAPLSSGGFLVTASLKGSANLEALEPDTPSSLPCNLATIVDQGETEPIAARYTDDGAVEWCARLAHNWQEVEAGSSLVQDDGTFLVAGQFTGEAELEVEGEAITISSKIEDSEPKPDGFLMRVCP